MYYRDVALCMNRILDVSLRIWVGYGSCKRTIRGYESGSEIYFWCDAGLFYGKKSEQKLLYRINRQNLMISIANSWWRSNCRNRLTIWRPTGLSPELLWLHLSTKGIATKQKLLLKSFRTLTTWSQHKVRKIMPLTVFCLFLFFLFARNPKTTSV